MYSDFIVRYDPDKDTEDDLFKKILKSLFLNRVMIKKPVIVFVGGDSGEAKSSTVVKIEKALLELRGLDIHDYMTEDDDVMNVYIPLQYPEKLKKILYDKKYKKVNIICLHEARDLVKAKLWHNFVSMAIADINAQVRKIKPLIIFITSQFIRDITTDIRYTLTYYVTCYRLAHGQTATINIYRMWKDDRDLESPKLKKRKLRGILLYPDGTHRVYRPTKFRFRPPPKDIQKIMDKNDLAAKHELIKGKIDKLMKEMGKELKVEDQKVNAMVKFYTKKPERLIEIFQKTRGKKKKLKEEFLKAHDLTMKEGDDFINKINEEMKNVAGQ